MRKRQVNNMHGGYRGSGVTLDWHTTYKPSMIQVENKPLQPIIPPSDLQPPTNKPLPTTPPQIINKSTNKISDSAIAKITGLTVGAVALGSYAGYKYINYARPEFEERQDIDELLRRRGHGNIIDEINERRDHILHRDIDLPNFGRDVWSILTRYRFDPRIVDPYNP